jgi:hypothetical protein
MPSGLPMTALYGILAGVAVIGGLIAYAVIAARRAGRDSAVSEAAKTDAEIKDAQLAVDQPSRDDVLGRLRGHDF